MYEHDVCVSERLYKTSWGYSWHMLCAYFYDVALAQNYWKKVVIKGVNCWLLDYYDELKLWIIA